MNPKLPSNPEAYLDFLQLILKTVQESDRALQYVERSKARNLVELLAARDLYPRGNVPQTVIEELDRLRREIVTEQRRIEMRSGVGEIANLEMLPALAEFQESRTYLNQLQQELDELIHRDIQPHDPTFSLTQRVEPVTFQQVRDLLPNSQTALIEWYIADETFLAFIVTPDSQTFHPHAEILVKAEARKEAIANQRLQAAHCVHFACHSIFDLESPLRSALVLAGVDLKALDLERCLTLGEIFGLNLSQCRLVALSACETGLTDPTSLSDEYIGLPSGFLYAGSPSFVRWGSNYG